MSTRIKLLEALKKKSGSFVSGEELSTVFGISRAAVSKHIGVLKKTGYTIESSPKKGYLFRGAPDLLLPEEIRARLETRVFGKKEIVYYPVTDSTNDRAKALAIAGAPEGCLVVAEEQKAGRGRRGRTWFSAPGDGICISIILRPVMPPSEASRITMMTAVALAESLISLTGLKVNIKWPNDILVHGKKLAGILTEMSMEMDVVDYVVVGLGLNVNSPLVHFSDEIKDLATSLFIEKGETLSRTLIISEYLKWFETYYDIVRNTGFREIMKRWKELSDIIGRDVTVDVVGTKIFGRVEDIDADGVLVIKDPSGTIHRVISGDVLLKDT